MRDILINIEILFFIGLTTADSRYSQFEDKLFLFYYLKLTVLPQPKSFSSQNAQFNNVLVYYMENICIIKLIDRS